MLLNLMLLQFCKDKNHPVRKLLKQDPMLMNEEYGECSLSMLARSINGTSSRREVICVNNAYQKTKPQLAMAKNLRLDIATSELGEPANGRNVKLDGPAMQMAQDYFNRLVTKMRQSQFMVKVTATSPNKYTNLSTYNADAMFQPGTTNWKKTLDEKKKNSNGQVTTRFVMNSKSRSIHREVQDHKLSKERFDFQLAKTKEQLGEVDGYVQNNRMLEGIWEAETEDEKKENIEQKMMPLDEAVTNAVQLPNSIDVSDANDIDEVDEKKHKKRKKTNKQKKPQKKQQKKKKKTHAVTYQPEFLLDMHRQDECRGEEESPTTCRVAINHPNEEGDYMHYYIKWLGYDNDEENTWEPEIHLTDTAGFDELVADYLSQ